MTITNKINKALRLMQDMQKRATIEKAILHDVNYLIYMTKNADKNRLQKETVFAMVQAWAATVYEKIDMNDCNYLDFAAIQDIVLL